MHVQNRSLVMPADVKNTNTMSHVHTYIHTYMCHRHSVSGTTPVTHHEVPKDVHPSGSRYTHSVAIEEARQRAQSPAHSAQPAAPPPSDCDPRLHGMHTGYPCSSHTHMYHHSPRPPARPLEATRTSPADASPATHGRPSARSTQACEARATRGTCASTGSAQVYEYSPPLDGSPLHVCV